MSSNLVCSRAGQFSWLAITWVNHIGSTVVKVVPISHWEQAVSVGVGFSPVADAFGSDGSIDSANRLACPDGDLRLREDPAALQPLDPEAGWAWAPGIRWERAANQPYGADPCHFCLRQAHQVVPLTGPDRVKKHVRVQRFIWGPLVSTIAVLTSDAHLTFWASSNKAV